MFIKTIQARFTAVFLHQSIAKYSTQISHVSLVVQSLYFLYSKIRMKSFEHSDQNIFTVMVNRTN